MWVEVLPSPPLNDVRRALLVTASGTNSQNVQPWRVQSIPELRTQLVLRVLRFGLDVFRNGQNSLTPLGYKGTTAIFKVAYFYDGPMCWFDGRTPEECGHDEEHDENDEENCSLFGHKHPPQQGQDL